MGSAQAEVIIIGAGFAGAATAWALTKRGVRDIVILEAEPVPGAHGSGLNAAMARRVIEDPILSALATESVAAIRALGAARGEALIDDSGGLLLGSSSDLDALQASAESVPKLAAELARWDRDAAIARVPALEGMKAEGGLFTPGCGVADIHALLQAYLAEAKAGGARLVLQAPVTKISVSGGRVRGVQTPKGRWTADWIVNAAGFRVGPVAAMAGAQHAPVRPMRRHLFTSAPLGGHKNAWPFVWDITNHAYFRPEGAGLLLCACDETLWPPEAPTVAPESREFLAERIAATLPGLAHIRPARTWCGSRVKTPDGRFIIGPDPGIDGLIWAAGLGGHGMTTSAGVGRLAAAAIIDGAAPSPYSSVFAPGRFA